MTQRARIDECVFRWSAKGREALAPPGEGGCHIHYQGTRKVGIGSITSKRPGAMTDIEWLAIRNGMTVVEVMKALEEASK